MVRACLPESQAWAPFGHGPLTGLLTTDYLTTDYLTTDYFPTLLTEFFSQFMPSYLPKTAHAVLSCLPAPILHY
jgi:hypothetical protein